MPERDEHGSYKLSQDRQVLDARLIARFRAHGDDPDYVLTYRELSEMLGQSVQSPRLCSKLSDSVKAVSIQLNTKLVRDRVKGGIIKLPCDQYGVIAEKSRKKVARLSKRNAKELGRMSQLAGVPDDEKAKLEGAASVLSAIGEFGGKKHVEKITDIVRQSGPVPIAKTLEAFRRA